ncbi:MAG TPA: hypothetical protein PK078_02905 [Anaerolineales bacterium]|nr:hypothetical protein [Anaerolineales bacterium]
MQLLFSILEFVVGLGIVISTIFSAVSTFVLPRSARSKLDRLVFGLVRRFFEFLMHFAGSYERRDKIMAYYAPLALMALVPTWYVLISIGYSFMYWALGEGDLLADFRLSGSSLLTLGFASSDGLLVTVLVFSEAMLGLIMVALLIAYLPTMYSAFSRREQLVNMLEVRAGNPPNPYDMLTRYHRIHGLDKLTDLWRAWEVWFADVEESHTTLPALVFFRSPRAENSWVTSAGAVLDSAAITLSSIDISLEMSGALCIRAGFICFHHVTDYFGISHPHQPSFPETPINITRAEYDDLIRKLEEAGLPIKPDREQAWVDYAGWRVNYDRTLLVLCSLVMAPPNVPWSSDRAPTFKLPPIFMKKKKHEHH